MAKNADTPNTGADTTSAFLASMSALNPVAAKAWMDFMSESARFMVDRFQQDLDTQKAMLSCKSPAELLQLQSEFYRQAIQQYTAEANRMLAIMTNATENAIDEAKSGHSRSYDDVPL